MGRIRLALLSCLALVLTAVPAAQAQSPQPRIVGGQTTTVEQYPWQAALVFDERFGGNDFQRQFCGGALLTARIVQTAAHCVFDGDPDPRDNTSFDPNDLDVVLGRTTLTSGDGQQLDVKVVWIERAVVERIRVSVKTQWAAVWTIRAVSKAPPQNWRWKSLPPNRSSKTRAACHGYCSIVVVSPPTIRGCGDWACAAGTAAIRARGKTGGQV